MTIVPVETPIETYTIRGVPVQVKREDLCWPYPPFAKARGVYASMIARPRVQTFAVADTARSMTGLLVSTIASTLGKRAIVGYPKYKKTPDAMPGSAARSKSLGMEVIGIPANRQFMIVAGLKQILSHRPEEIYLFPNGLKTPESVGAVEMESLKVLAQLGKIGTAVVPTGAGTHLAGVIKGLTPDLLHPGACPVFVCVMGHHHSTEKHFRREMEKLSGRKCSPERLKIIDRGYDYYDVRPQFPPPFPSGVQYEWRAWNWLAEPGVVESLPQPILFWNIGSF